MVFDTQDSELEDKGDKRRIHGRIDKGGMK
jgi:hypothetical protein